MSETNKCGNCGTIVPAEKAFCPNCSEPMEPEEAPNRADSLSSEMMSTIRDDPENYRELAARLKQERAAARSGASGPHPAYPVPTVTPMAPAPLVNPDAPQAAGYNYPSPAPYYGQPQKSGKRRFVVLGIVAALVIILVVGLFAFKLI